jgi:ATP-binding protein involved in chromosome partitioning
MRIAVPVANGSLCAHFGHCERFALIDVDDEDRAVRLTRYVTPPAHEPGVLPRWLHTQGVNVVIAGGMGQRAQRLFQDNAIQVVVGVPNGGSPEEIAAAYLNGALQPGENPCDH